MRSTRPSCAAGGAYASGDDRPPAHSSRAQEACGTDVHFFVWVILILITVFIDIFRLHDLPGRTKGPAVLIRAGFSGRTCSSAAISSKAGASSPDQLIKLAGLRGRESPLC
jgi:hypothetical protein